jgi:GNAT superfamily N-acetyltransferase
VTVSAQLHFTEIDPRTLSDDDVRHKNAFVNVMNLEELPEDPPRPLEHTAVYERSVPNTVDVRQIWAREGDGAIAGVAELWWTTTEDNRHVVHVWIGVRPDRRRARLGTDLLRLAARVARDLGRTTMMGETSERVPSGAAFAARIGAQAAQATHTNRLVLADVDMEMVDRWIAHGPQRAPGYSLVRIDGPTPDAYLDEVVAMANVMNTAPRDDLDLDDDNMLPEHLRAWERLAESRGEQWWSLYAQHEATGVFAGYTHVSYDPKVPGTVWQYGTAVRPEHRGHALGKWLKAAMLRRVVDERPGVIDIRTGNADSNDAMLGINYGLGFRPFVARVWWQAKLDAVRKHLEER